MTISIGAGQVKQAISTNFQDAALGRIGNLAFAGKPGATPRAPGPSLFQRIGNKVEAAIAYVKASPQQRASAQVVALARQLSTDTSSLLGTLTGSRADRGASGKVAGALASLLHHVSPLATAAHAGTGEIVNPALQRHLGQLGFRDLAALRDGPLGDADSRAAILAQLDPALRPAADALLTQIDASLDKEVSRRASSGPIASFREIMNTAVQAGAVNVGAVDTQAMDAVLEKLLAGAGMLKTEGQTLRHFFAPSLERMSDAELGDLARGLSQTPPGGGQPSVLEGLLQASDLRGPHAVAVAGRRDALEALQGAVADQIKQRLDTAVVVKGTAQLLVPLMNLGTPIKSDEMIRNLEMDLGSKVGEMRAGHLSSQPGTNPTPNLLARALADLPTPQLDRLLDGATTVGLRKAMAGVDSLPEPQQTALRVAIERVADRLADKLADTLEQTRTMLDHAVQRGDRAGVTLGLAKLSHEIAQAKQFDQVMDRQVAVDALSDARETVTDAMALLRAPSNVEGPLNADSLAGLSHHEIGLLRQAREELGEFGVAIDRDALREAVALRTATNISQTQDRCAGLLRALAQPDVTGAQVVKILRDISDVLAGSLAIEMALGEEVSPARMLEVARAVVGHALAAVKEEAGDAADLLVDRMLTHDQELLGPLSAAMAIMPGEISNLSADYDEGSDMQMLRDTASLMGVTNSVLTALRDSLYESAQTAGRVLERVSSEPELTAETRDAVAGQFGVHVEQDVSSPSLVLGGEQRKALENAITQPMIGQGPTPTTLDVGGMPTVFTVDKQFVNDAIERTGVSFSVSGRDANGNRIDATTLQPGMDRALRPAALGEALGALERMVGGAVLPLTRLMNQELVGSMLGAMLPMGQASPIRLSDGTPFMPGGAGQLHFDIEQHPDGSLSAKVRITFTDMATGTGLLPDGTGFGVIFDPDASSFVVKFSVAISPDGATLSIAEPLSLQYQVAETGRMGDPR